MCGDSTNSQDMQTLMAGTKADMVLTDPPYNVGLGMGESLEKKKERKRRTDGKVIMNDKMGDSEFLDFLKAANTNFKNNLKNGGVFYIWYASIESLNFRKSLQETGLEIRQTLIWVKHTFSLVARITSGNTSPVFMAGKKVVLIIGTADATFQQ